MVYFFYDALKASGEFEDSALLLVFDEAQLGKLAGGSKERPQETSLGLLLRSRAAKAGSGKRFSSNMLSGVGAFYDAVANFLSSMRTQNSRGWTFYVDGSRLLFNDVGFSASLVGQCVRGRNAGASRRARIEKDGEGPAHDRALHHHPADTSVAGRPRLRLRGDPALLPGLLPLVLHGAAAEFGEAVRRGRS